MTGNNICLLFCLFYYFCKQNQRLKKMPWCIRHWQVVSCPNVFLCAMRIRPPFVYSRLCTFAILIPAITRLAGRVGGRFAHSQWMSQYWQRCDGLQHLLGKEGGGSVVESAAGLPCCGWFREVIITETTFSFLAKDDWQLQHLWQKI